MATPARFARRPDGDVAPAVTAASEGGSTRGLLFRLATTASHSHGAAPLLGLVAVEQFQRRCTSFLWRGFTMKSSAPAFRHLLRASSSSWRRGRNTADVAGPEEGDGGAIVGRGDWILETVTIGRGEAWRR